MERISELPTEILHQILSLLPTKTAARTAVLSKPWLKVCSTNPNLNFDQSDFEARPRNGFSRIVDNTLERYRRQNLPISAIKLCIFFFDQTDTDRLIDKWLDIIAEKRASQVSLLVKNRSGDCYSLLAETIFAMDSLQQLELNHCKIQKQKALLSEDKIKCVNLRNLTLCSVTFCESALDSLISCCHQIQTISFQYCIRLRCIRVSKNLPNLLSLSIFSCLIEEVHMVGAPKMLTFEHLDKQPYNNDTRLRMLNIGTCQNLRKVELEKTAIDDTVLFQLIQKLQSVKELILHYCRYLSKIKISSSTLEVCSIVYCDLLVEVTFNVPKLLSLAFSKQYRLPCLSFESVSSQCRISINYDYIRNGDQLVSLRRSLFQLNDQVVDLTLCSISKGLRPATGIDHLPAPVDI